MSTRGRVGEGVPYSKVRESDHVMGWSFPGGCELYLMFMSGAESLRGGGGLEESRMDLKKF
eukprot:5451120-Prymnesium_polylepis.2